MGFVKEDILKRYDPVRGALYFHTNEGVEFDPLHYQEYPNFLTPDECAYISRIILRDEQDILSIPNASSKPYQGLTKQHEVYNWFNHPDIIGLNIPQRLLELEEFKELNSAFLQCWTNVLRQGEELKRHFHNWTPIIEYACNIFLSGNPNTGTHYYRDADIPSYTPNEVGTLTIVGQRLEHEVKTNIYKQPRISMAIDVIKDTFAKDRKDIIENRFVYYRNDAVSETPLCMQL